MSNCYTVTVISSHDKLKLHNLYVQSFECISFQNICLYSKHIKVAPYSGIKC